MEDPRSPAQGGISVALQHPLKHVHWLESLCFAQKFYKIKSFNYNNLRLTERTHRSVKERLKLHNCKYQRISSFIHIHVLMQLSRLWW